MGLKFKTKAQSRKFITKRKTKVEKKNLYLKTPDIAIDNIPINVCYKKNTYIIFYISVILSVYRCICNFRFDRSDISYASKWDLKIFFKYSIIRFITIYLPIFPLDIYAISIFKHYLLLKSNICPHRGSLLWSITKHKCSGQIAEYFNSSDLHCQRDF